MPPTRITRAAIAPPPTASKTPIRRAVTAASAGRELGSDEMKALRASITKRYGADMLKHGTDIDQPRRVPSGIFTFDYATLGGIPQSRISMFWGAKHSGKSSAGLRLTAGAQNSQPDKQAVVLDIEGCIAFDTRVIDAYTGRVATAQAIYEGRLALSPLSLDEATGKLRPMPFTAWFNNGVKPTLLVGTKTTSLRATHNHRFYIYSPRTGRLQWLRADELAVGMQVSRPAAFNSTEMFWDEITTITDGGEVQTYDFTVDDTHNFVANDMVIHNTFDEVWAEKQGVNTDTALVVQPESGEQAVDLLIGLIETTDISLILVDSLAALVPLKELESSAEDAHVGQAARMITSMLRKATASLIKERRRGHLVTVLAINQIRSRIGGWAPAGQEALGLPGGKALEHFTSLQCKFKNKEVKDKDNEGFETTASNEHAFTIDKNKCNGGMRAGEYRMMRRDDDELGLQEGDIDDAGTMLAFAKKLGWYTGGGKSWTLTFGDYSHTFANVAEAVKGLYENRDVYWSLRCHLIAHNAEKQKQRTDFIEYILSGSSL